MTILHIDIETIPSQLEWVMDDIATNIKPPATIKKQESIDKWMKDKSQDAIRDKWLKTSFNGAVGEIICIAWAFDDEPVQVIGRELGGTEFGMLEGFMDDIDTATTGKHSPDTRKDITWCGHYITGFDLRFLWQRMIVNNVKMPIEIP